MPIGRQQAVE